MRFDWWDSQILELLRPLRSSAGDLVPYSHSSGSYSSITTGHFLYQISLCYIYKIRYIILWHLLSIEVPFYEYTYSHSGCRHYWSAIGGAPADANWENLEIHFEAMIVRTGRCTWRPRSSEFGDALGGQNQIELKDVLGGRDWAGLEKHLKADIV
jgi:hypothetical protein